MTSIHLNDPGALTSRARRRRLAARLMHLSEQNECPSWMLK
jgi:hypothetical protein